jgi:hypothetical protein
MYVAAWHRLGAAGALAHHVTNIVVREGGDGGGANGFTVQVTQ